MRYCRDSNTRWYTAMGSSMRALSIWRAESKKWNEGMPQAIFLCLSGVFDMLLGVESLRIGNTLMAEIQS